MPKNKEMPKKRKTRKKKAIAISLIGVLTAGGVGGAVYYQQNSKVKMPAETKKAQSATAELGSISNTIVGTGNLALSDAQSQTIPSGIEIEEVMVESGDKVTKGETIATVSKASVLKAVEETQEEIKELDDQISDCQNDDDTDSIDASVDGRVKLIYAETGDDITDVMLENGSVLVLSLDGKMAVDIKAAGLKEDDTVNVTLSSGTQVTGTVESVSGSTCTITVTDNGTVYDDEVTVTDSDGKELGTGKLYIHEPLEVTGTTGTVSAVNVSENESVSSGTELFTLENSTSNVQYEQLLAEREAYSVTLKKLLQLSKNQKITADISGTVQSVNVSAGSSDSSSSNTSSTSSSGSSGTSGISKMSYTTGNYTAGNSNYNNATVSDSQAGIIRLSSTNMSAMSYTSVGMSYVNNFISTSSENTEGCENTEASEDEAVQSAASAEENIERQTEFTVQNESEEINDENNTNPATVLTLRITTEGQSTADTLAITAPTTGNTPTEEVSAADGSYTGSISWNPGDGSFAAGTVYQANVTLYAGEGYVFTGSSVNGIDNGVVSGVTASADGSTLSFTITYPQTAGDSDSGNNSGNGSENNSGSNSQDNKNNNSSDGNSNGFPDTDNSDSDKSGTGNNSDSTGGAGDSSGNNGQGNTSGNQSGTSGNTGTGGSAGTGSSGGSAASVQSGSGATSADTKSDTSSGTSASSDTTDLTSAYSTEVEAFTISSDEDMVLAVSVDELDINSVELGQEAVVELDAIEDETFTGEVTAIGDTASASGGVAKYTVSLTIPKDDRMKQGMNASATITIDSRENVVTIPVNALQEEGSKVFVYTEQDDDGNLSGEKEVTTGLSNGTTVEITEGLQEGETVYYNKTGNTQNSTSGSDGFPGGDFDKETGGPGGDMSSDKNGTRGGNDSQGGGNRQGGPGNMPNM